MKQINFRKTVGLAVVIVLLPTMALAYGDQGGGKGGNCMAQTAIDAWAGKNQGDSVEFTNRRYEPVSVACRERNQRMVAEPEGGHRGKGRR